MSNHLLTSSSTFIANKLWFKSQSTFPHLPKIQSTANQSHASSRASPSQTSCQKVSADGNLAVSWNEEWWNEVQTQRSHTNCVSAQNDCKWGCMMNMSPKGRWFRTHHPIWNSESQKHIWWTSNQMLYHIVKFMWGRCTAQSAILVFVFVSFQICENCLLTGHWARPTDRWACQHDSWWFVASVFSLNPILAIVDTKALPRWCSCSLPCQCQALDDSCPQELSILPVLWHQQTPDCPDWHVAADSRFQR